MVAAVALVGFYRGDLVNPGDRLELSTEEFNELRGMGKVDFAPEKPAPEPRGRSWVDPAKEQDAYAAAARSGSKEAAKKRGE